MGGMIFVLLLGPHIVEVIIISFVLHTALANSPVTNKQKKQTKSAGKPLEVKHTHTFEAECLNGECMVTTYMR